MRIAIYHNLPSGGGKRALYEMTRRLACEDTVDVYTLSSANQDFCDIRPYCNKHIVFPFSTLPRARSPFSRINRASRSLDLLRLRAVQRRIAAQIDREGYDVVFVHACQYGQSPTVLGFLHTPSVYFCAEPPRLIYEPGLQKADMNSDSLSRALDRIDPLRLLHQRLLARMDRSSVLASSLVLTNSAYSRETLYHVYGIDAKICYLGVDVQHFRPLSLPKANFVVSVGALGAHKGFDFLLRSLALIETKRRPSLVIVTNQDVMEQRAYLHELAQQLDVGLEIRALVSDTELVELYNQALLTVYSPVMEPFGLVPIESMACGTPVIGVFEGGVRETVINERTGLLTERDPVSFAGAIDGLLCDTARLREFGVQSRIYVEKSWQWDHSISTLRRYLENVSTARQQVQDASLVLA